MKRDKNVSAGIALGLYAFVFLLCLLAALFLPARFFLSGRFSLAAPLLALIALPILLRLAQHSRIRDAVEQQAGGRLLRLRRLPFWKQDWIGNRYRRYGGTKYEVEFADLSGVTHRAICRSGFLCGVEWLEELPPDA